MKWSLRIFIKELFIILHIADTKKTGFLRKMRKICPMLNSVMNTYVFFFFFEEKDVQIFAKCIFLLYCWQKFSSREQFQVIIINRNCTIHSNSGNPNEYNMILAS